MPYDETLAKRVRDLLDDRTAFVEKKMFGGIAFLVGGNMTVGILGPDLVVRLPADENESALARPHTRPMDFTGRPMKGWIYVAPAGTRTAASLGAWLDRALAFARAQPAKKPKRKSAASRSAKKRPAPPAASTRSKKKTAARRR